MSDSKTPREHFSDSYGDAPGIVLGQYAIPGGLSEMRPFYALDRADDGSWTLYWRQENEHLYNSLSSGQTGEELARFLAVTVDLGEIYPAVEAAAPDLAAAFKATMNTN